MSDIADKPAFPRPSSATKHESATGAAQAGMTMRQYYAGLAPFPPPVWFEPVFDEPEANPHNGTAIAERAQRKERAIWAQWPVAYADALLAELEKP